MEVVGRLHVLLNPASTPADRSEAGAWLQAFRQSRESWEQCCQLLQDKSVDTAVLVFASQALRDKIMYALEELAGDTAALGGLRTTLAGLLESHGSGPRQVRRQLAVGLACLAVQDPAWTTVLNDTLSLMNTHVEAGLELLAALPEVLFDPRLPVKTDVRMSVCERVVGPESASQVLNLLATVMSSLQTPNNSNNNANTQSLVLSTYSVWLTHAAAPASVILSPMLSVALACLGTPPLFDDARGCVVDALARLDLPPTDESVATLEAVSPAILSLVSPLTAALGANAHPTVAGIVGILCELGLASLPLAVAGVPSAVEIVSNVAMSVCSVAASDAGLLAGLEFWVGLSCAARDYSGGGGAAANPLRELCGHAIELLLGFVTRRAERLPPNTFDPETELWKDDDWAYVANCLSELAAGVGIQHTHTLLSSHLNVATQSASSGSASGGGGGGASTAALVSVLFGYCAVAGTLAHAEAGLAPPPEVLTQLAASPRVVALSLRVLGAYARCYAGVTAGADVVLGAVVTHCMSGLACGHGGVESAAADCLLRVCEAGRVVLAPMLSSFLQLLERVLSSEGMRVGSKVACIRAVGCVVSALPATELCTVLQALFSGFAESLKRPGSDSLPTAFYVYAAALISSSCSARDLPANCAAAGCRHPALTCLECVSGSLTPPPTPTPQGSTNTALTPTYASAVADYITQTVLCVQADIHPAVATLLLPYLLGLLNATHVVGVVTAFATLLDVYETDTPGVLEAVFAPFVSAAVAWLADPNAYVYTPDAAVEAIHLIESGVSRWPSALANTDFVSAIAQCSSVGSACTHPEARAASLSLFALLFELGAGGGQGFSPAAVFERVSVFGASVVAATLSGVTDGTLDGAVAAILLDSVRECSMAAFVEWIKGWLVTVPTALLLDAEKEGFGKSLCEYPDDTEAVLRELRGTTRSRAMVAGV